MQIVNVLGMPPQDMIARGRKWKKFFIETWEDGPSGEKVRVFRLKTDPKLTPRTLETILGAETGGPKGRRKGELGHTPEDYHKLLDILYKIMQYEPERRITPVDALTHPFFLDTARRVAATQTADGQPVPAPMDVTATTTTAAAGSLGLAAAAGVYDGSAPTTTTTTTTTTAGMPPATHQAQPF